jgi:hypothetical protein
MRSKAYVLVLASIQSCWLDPICPWCSPPLHTFFVHSSIQIESVREFSKASAGGFDAGAMGAMQGAMHSEFMMGKHPQQVCMRHACPLLFGRMNLRKCVFSPHFCQVMQGAAMDPFGAPPSHMHGLPMHPEFMV